MSSPAFRHTPFPLLVLGLLGPVACHAPQAESDPANPPSATPVSPGDDVGAFSLALAVTPTDVRCVRAVLTTVAGDQMIRTFDANPGGASQFLFTGVPAGRTRVFVEAFNLACSALTPATPATWVSQGPTEAELVAGLPQNVDLVLRRPSAIRVSGDFRESNPEIFFRFPAWEAPATIVGASVESQSIGQLVNASAETRFVPNFTFSGDGASFGISNTCLAGETCCQTGRTLSPGTSCAVHLVFRPTRVGKLEAVLDAGSNVFVPVRGTGTVVGNASLTPPDGNLGAVPQLTTTVTNFTVSNGNTTPFPTTAFITGASEFQIIGGSCLGLPQLEPGAGCIISVRYAASTLGPRSAVLNVGAMSGGLQASLSATTVTAPFAGITPFTGDFGSVAVGQSRDLTLTVLNATAVSVAIIPGITGPNASEFTRLHGVGGTCSSILPSGGSCITLVRFSPTSAGSKTATLSMGPELTTAALVGTGASAGSVRFTDDSVDFGQLAVGQAKVRMLTLTNTTSSAFTIAPSLSNTTDFRHVSNTCDATLPAAATCTFQVSMNPTSVGSKTAMFSAGPGSVATTLTGTGVAAAPPITNLVVNDHGITGADTIDNSTQWVVQTNFHAGASVAAFSDRTGVTISSAGDGTLDGKTWIRTAADSKLFGLNMVSPPPLASFTINGKFVYVLADHRLDSGTKPKWLDDTYTAMTFEVLIAEGATTRHYGVWRKTVTSGSTVILPAVASTTAPCYLVVVE